MLSRGIQKGVQASKANPTKEREQGRRGGTHKDKEGLHYQERSPLARIVFASQRAGLRVGAPSARAPERGGLKERDCSVLPRAPSLRNAGRPLVRTPSAQCDDRAPWGESEWFFGIEMAFADLRSERAPQAPR